MYSNNIVNFQESTTILNACAKKAGNLLKAPRIYKSYLIYMYKENFALKNLKWLICPKTKSNQILYI